MPWCPNCHTEYEAGSAVCADCGAALVEGEPRRESPVVVLHAATATEARIAEATLQAEGIPAFVQPPDILLPQHATVVDDENPELDVLVPAEAADRAAAILNAPAVTEEELAEAEEADPNKDESSQ